MGDAQANTTTGYDRRGSEPSVAPCRSCMCRTRGSMAYSIRKHWGCQRGAGARYIGDRDSWCNLPGGCKRPQSRRTKLNVQPDGVAVGIEHAADAAAFPNDPAGTGRERRTYRLACELHDEAAQSLTSLLVRLRLLERARNPEEAQQRVQELRELTARALEDVRRVALDLRPTILDDLGLAPALQWRVDEFNKGEGVPRHDPPRGSASLPASTRYPTCPLSCGPGGVVQHQPPCPGKPGCHQSATGATGLSNLKSAMMALALIRTTSTQPLAFMGWGGRHAGTCGDPRRHVDCAFPPWLWRRYRCPCPEPGRKGRRMSQIRILLVDDHMVVRIGLKALIDAEKDPVVVGEASNGVEGVAKAIPLCTGRHRDGHLDARIGSSVAQRGHALLARTPIIARL